MTGSSRLWFLVAATRPGTDFIATDKKPLADGEWVIPALPIGDCNYFVNAEYDGMALYAKPALVPADEIDTFTARLIKALPGIPAGVLEQLVYKTAMAADSIRPTKAEADLYQVFVAPEQTSLCRVRDQHVIPLWNELKG